MKDDIDDEGSAKSQSREDACQVFSECVKKLANLEVELRNSETEYAQKLVTQSQYEKKILDLEHRLLEIQKTMVGSCSLTKSCDRAVTDAGLCTVTWNKIENSLDTLFSMNQTIALMEKDFELGLIRRDSVQNKIEKIMAIKKKLKPAGICEDNRIMKQLDEKLNGLREKLVFTLDKINEIQTTVMQLQESKSKYTNDNGPASFVTGCSLDEAKDLLNNCFTLIVNKGVYDADKEAQVDRLQAELDQCRTQLKVQRQLMQHLDTSQTFDDLSVLPFTRAPHHSESGASDSEIIADSPFDTHRRKDHAFNLATNSSNPSVSSKISRLFTSEYGHNEVRRKTTTPEDLRLSLRTHSPRSIDSRPGSVDEFCSPSLRPAAATSHLQRTYAAGRPHCGNPSARRDSSLNKTDKSDQPSVLKQALYKNQSLITNDHVAVCKTLSMPATSLPNSSSSVLRSRSVSSGATNLSHVNASTMNIHQGQSGGDSRATGRSLPSIARSVISSMSCVTRGVGTSGCSSIPLTHCFTASGHSKAVLSVFAGEELLFTGSKDRTCKIWDLTKNEEILTLDGHPNNVTGVKYSEATDILYTCSAHLVRVWDPRRGNVCVKTMLSSGVASDGGATGNKNVPRLLACPRGENIISGIAVNSTSSILYTAASDAVLVWDLRMFKSVNILPGSHRSTILALAFDDKNGRIRVAMGYRNPYIKVFELMEETPGVLGQTSPDFTLGPPHLDSVQSLCLAGDFLFSGSRDACIKKWDLTERQCTQSLNGVHKDWICGLTLIPGSDGLASASRDGFMKFWNVDNCCQVGEILAHKGAINAMSANSQFLFSASDDQTVRCWR